jgi:exodeoxyribonuclease V gamma subunit
VLLGVAMTDEEQRLFGGVLPLDDVESGAIDLAGRLAELIDRLQAALDSLRRPQPITEWALALAAAADALTAPVENWQRAELARLLDDAVNEAGGADTPLALGELRALLGERLQGRPTRANFRTGHLTICTLVPMRSVPHRVVCLLGLDDGTFPRKTVRDGDDLMLREPRVGERDSRTEDRQMLLDALLAARDRLIITYTGNDERTNIPRPPAVPVGELLDMVDRTVRAPRERIVVRHPLQPFDRRNFTAGALVPGKPWSFDRVTLDGARALTGSRAPKPPFLAGPLPEERASVLELEELVRFAAHPVQAFLRGRLGLSVRDYTDEIEDALPVELDGLARYAVGQRMLEALLAGASVDVAVDAEIARGKLPPRRLADPVIARVRPVVEEIAARAGIAPTVSLDVRVFVEGRPLTGTVAGIAGDVLRSVNFSRVSARHRLQAWVRLLALSAADPDRRFEALTAGRGEEGVALFRIGVVGAERVRAELAALAGLFDAAMREPLPIACRTSAAFAASGEDAARAAWTSSWNFAREDADTEHQLVYGGVVPFDTLLGDPRFASCARALWAGLLEHER